MNGVTMPALEAYYLYLNTLIKKEEYYTKDIAEKVMRIYKEHGENIWIAKNAFVASTACLSGPLIIDEDAEIRHCAYIRGSVIVGKKAVVGNSTELKNCILLDKVQVPHYNYVGDSVLGNKSHMGAGAVCSNLKADGKAVVIHGESDYITNIKTMEDNQT